jgi:hypothetical protein
VNLLLINVIKKHMCIWKSVFMNCFGRAGLNLRWDENGTLAKYGPTYNMGRLVYKCKFTVS